MTALVLEWRCVDTVRVGWVPQPSGPTIPAAIVGPPGVAGSGGSGGEPAIAAGTTAQYWRGDKSWQTLDKVAAGLGNVDNTSDANKPVSTLQASAIAGRQPLATVLTNTTASFTTAQETKLAGIATGATVNDTDANLKARANHTGTQAVGTITGNWPVAQLNGGTGASSTTFWRGDGTWATPAGGGASEPGYASGRRHALLASGIFTPTSGSTLTAGSLYLKPVHIRSSITISALYAEIVTAVASSNFQIGIYATDATSLMPTGAPVYSSGNISAAAIGMAGVTGMSTSLTPGWYWVGWMGSGAIAARTSGSDGAVVRFCGYSAGNLASHLVRTGTFGTWPTLTGSFSGDGFSDGESSSRCATIWAVP